MLELINDELPRIYKKLCDEVDNDPKKVSEVGVFIDYVLLTASDKIAKHSKSGLDKPRPPPKRDQRKTDKLISARKDTLNEFDGHARSRIGVITANTKCPGAYWRSQETLDMVVEGRIILTPGTKKPRRKSYMDRIKCTNTTNPAKDPIKGPKMHPADNDRPYICRTCRTAFAADVKRGLIDRE